MLKRAKRRDEHDGEQNYDHLESGRICCSAGEQQWGRLSTAVATSITTKGLGILNPKESRVIGLFQEISLIILIQSYRVFFTAAYYGWRRPSKLIKTLRRPTLARHLQLIHPWSSVSFSTIIICIIEGEAACLLDWLG